MRGRALAASLVLALACPAGLRAQTPEEDLVTGVRAVGEGDFESGILLLKRRGPPARSIVQEDRTALTLKDGAYGATPLHWAALK